jgi:hypothetical protein
MVSGTTQMALPYSNLLTGIGLVASMQVTGPAPNYGMAQIREDVGPSSNSCPPAWGTCSGNATFTVGLGGYSFDQRYLPPLLNVYYDQHITTDTTSLLHNWGVDACTLTCAQVFSCRGAQIGAFTIQRDFVRDVLNGQGVTRVNVTKW